MGRSNEWEQLRPVGLSADRARAWSGEGEGLPIRRQPRLAGGLVTLVLGPNTILVEGAPHRQVFAGNDVDRLLAPLLPLLDGTRSVDELASALGESANRVRSMLALLEARGLLDDLATHYGDAATYRAAALPFLSRSKGYTRCNITADEAFERLGSQRILVAGSLDLGERILSGLRASGISADFGSGDPSVVVNWRKTAALTIVAGTHNDSSLQDILAECELSSHRCLRVVALPNAIEVGPLIDASWSACHRCMNHRRVALGLEDATEQSCVVGSDVLDVAAAFAVCEATALVTRLSDVRAVRGIWRIDIPAWNQDVYFIPRRVGCEVCGLAPAEHATGHHVAYDYEQSIETPPADLMPCDDVMSQHRPAHIILQRLTKMWEASPRVALDDSIAPLSRAGEKVTTGKRVARQERQVLEDMLRLTAGIQYLGSDLHALPKRWAPSGGNLGSVQIHGIARCLTDQLPGGAFHFDAFANAVVGVSAEPATFEEVAREAGLHPPENCTAILVLTADLARVSRKYGEFAYKLVHLDAGCALVQLWLGLRAWGYEAQMGDHWNDIRLANIMNLDWRSEPITATVALVAE